MSVIVNVEKLVKTYKLYDSPFDRLKEAILPGKKKHYKEFRALNGLTFQVNKGDAIGILGKNGSGKSTLLKMITGVLTPTSGTIDVNGRISAILELGAGFNPEYTGRENIFLNGMMMGLTNSEIEEKLNSIIEFADIGDFIEQPVKVYSSGMFARLAFAVSINVEPDLLIVDEALAVGDSRFQIKCINKMKELKEEGTTILFVSHATEQVKRFCNKALWIKDGELIVSGQSSEVVDLYEDYMKNDVVPDLNKKIELDVCMEVEEDFVVPLNNEIMSLITKYKLNKANFNCFDRFEVEVEYEIYEEIIEGFLLGVAIYTPKREYIFGPNTYLEKIEIPNNLGRHVVKYIIPELPILSGTYLLDIGVFNNEGIVCIDYKQEAIEFHVTNKYFSEGQFYINHGWEVIK
ncbi:ABC transporter ATP-binding protein [Paenibacillus terrigena]|uniref:ABC transporter ATP-binding protein n=1 Tax=Paenibacillus terrigena TaxID=369333 RepID=UPI000361B70B|nr:ABC transporter ATP-binding protein [Paenibacillus terrigena]